MDKVNNKVPEPPMILRTDFGLGVFQKFILHSTREIILINLN